MLLKVYKENNYDPAKFGLEKEFQLCSQKLGMDYFLLNKEKNRFQDNNK